MLKMSIMNIAFVVIWKQLFSDAVKKIHTQLLINVQVPVSFSF